jgi:hypothetical protein
MANLVQDFSSGLTAYNKDGLELFIHTDGSVYASQSAMARMLNIPESTVRSAINARDFLPVLHTQVVGAEGSNARKLHGVKTLTTLAKKYSPELLERFSEMGANVYLYQLAGYKVGVKVEAPTDLPSQLETAKALVAALEAHASLLDKVDAAVGVSHKVRNQEQDDELIYTVDDLFELRGIATPDLTTKQNFSRSLCAAVRNDTRAEMAVAYRTWVNRKGIKKSYAVTGYKKSALPAFDNLCAIRGWTAHV